MTNTIIKYEGIDYRLIREAELTNHQMRAVYEAPAIREGEVADEDGWQPAFTIRWEIINEECEPENACDWDCPDEVLESGEYNPETGRYF